MGWFNHVKYLCLIDTYQIVCQTVLVQVACKRQLVCKRYVKNKIPKHEWGKIKIKFEKAENAIPCDIQNKNKIELGKQEEQWKKKKKHNGIKINEYIKDRLYPVQQRKICVYLLTRSHLMKSHQNPLQLCAR